MAPVPHGGEAANTEGLASRQPGTRPSRGPRPLRRRQHTGPEPGAPGHGVLCSEHSWNRWTDFAPLTAAVAPTTASSRARRLIGGDRSPRIRKGAQPLGRGLRLGRRVMLRPRRQHRWGTRTRPSRRQFRRAVVGDVRGSPRSPLAWWRQSSAGSASAATSNGRRPSTSGSL